MRRSCLLAGCLALALLPAAVHGAPGDPAPGNSTPVAAKDASTATTPAKAVAVAHPAPHARTRSAQWAYVDPKTGKLTDRPPAEAGTARASSPEATARAAAAPVQEAVPGVTAAGGLVMQLDDRFTSYLVATVDKDGKVILRHEPASRDARGKE
jgi:hypothetical protein